MGFDRVAVFTATKASERRDLGRSVTSWLNNYKGQIVDKCVTQSSDNEFHCVTITLFCQDRPNETSC